MAGELIAPDAFLRATRDDERLSEGGGFARREHPPDDVATENIKDHGDLAPVPSRRPFEFGDIPTSKRIRRCREQLGRGVRGMASLCAALAYFLMRGEVAMHRALGAVIHALVERYDAHLRRCEIETAIVMQSRAHARALDRWRELAWSAAARAVAHDSTSLARRRVRCRSPSGSFAGPVMLWRCQANEGRK